MMKCGQWVPWQDWFSMTVEAKPVHVRASVTGRTSDEAKAYRDYLDACVNALRGMDPEKLGEVISQARRIVAVHYFPGASDTVDHNPSVQSLAIALVNLEAPVTETNHEEIGSGGQPTCGDLAAEATEPEIDPAELCRCGCGSVCQDYLVEADHLAGRLEATDAELAKATAELELARRSVSRRDAHLEKVEAELAAAKAELANVRTQTTGALPQWIQDLIHGM